MTDIRKLYVNRFTDYPDVLEVKRVADVSERPYAIFLIVQPPDAYSLSSHLRDETRHLFKKASLDVSLKISSKFAWDSETWKQVLITNEDYGKRFYKLLLTEKGKQKYPDIVSLEDESLHYWINHYIDEDIIRGIDNLLPEFLKYVTVKKIKLEEEPKEGVRLTSEQLKKLHPDFANWFEQNYPLHKDTYQMNTFMMGDVFIHVPNTHIHVKEDEVLPTIEKEKSLKLAKAKALAQKQRIEILKMGMERKGTPIFILAK